MHSIKEKYLKDLKKHSIGKKRSKIICYHYGKEIYGKDSNGIDINVL